MSQLLLPILLGMLIGGLLFGSWGIVIGALVGALWKNSKSTPRIRNTRSQQKFLQITFGVAGHVAQADGQVSTEEIRCFKQALRELGINPTYDSVALSLFEGGTQPDFDLAGSLRELAEACHGERTLILNFIEIQVAVACSDGDYSSSERKIIETCCVALGLPLEQIEGMARRYLGRQGETGNGAWSRPGASERGVEQAYEILGVDAGAPWEEIQRAYMRKMKEFHPDKLLSKGLPQEFMNFATERTKEFTKAYRLLKKEIKK